MPDPSSSITTPKSPSRWEVQWSPKYGQPFQMIYYSPDKESCDAWLSQYGDHYSQNGMTQVIKVN
jgi:hypothetical protein